MTKLALRNEWATRVTEFKTSGQTAAAWCSTHHLKLHQLKYWLRRQNNLSMAAASTAVKAAATPTRWLSVEGSASEAVNLQTPLLIRVGKATIEIVPGFDPELLADAVQALAKSC